MNMSKKIHTNGESCAFDWEKQLVDADIQKKFGEKLVGEGEVIAGAKRSEPNFDFMA